MMEHKPIILIYSDIEKIWENSYSELGAIKEKICHDENTWCLNALYVYCYAIFESTLYKSFERILKAFPDRIKLKEKNEDIKAQLSESALTYGVVDTAAVAFAKSFAYGELIEVLDAYNNVLQIGLNKSKVRDEQWYTDLDNYKLKRNAVIHTGSDKFEITKDTLLKCIEIVQFALKSILEKIECVYKKYTRRQLIKDTWDYVLGNRLPYAQYVVEIKDDSFYIKGDELNSHAGSLASSEKTLLFLLLLNYSSGIITDSKFYKDMKPFGSLSSENLNKIGYMLELFKCYPLLFQ
jgi:hypothetical protein